MVVDPADHGKVPSCKATKLAEKVSKLDTSEMHRFMYWLMSQCPKKSQYMRSVLETCERSLDWEDNR